MFAALSLRSFHCNNKRVISEEEEEEGGTYKCPIQLQPSQQPPLSLSRARRRCKTFQVVWRLYYSIEAIGYDADAAWMLECQFDVTHKLCPSAFMYLPLV